MHFSPFQNQDSEIVAINLTLKNSQSLISLFIKQANDGIEAYSPYAFPHVEADPQNK